MNWKALITEIRGHGLSQAQIGERIGRSQAWVAAVLAEKYTDLRWSDGQALLALRDALHSCAAVDRQKQPITDQEKAA